ncbi:MAG: hypothetical protein WC444_05895 [Candidatus Paceibacterota bacterium]
MDTQFKRVSKEDIKRDVQELIDGRTGMVIVLKTNGNIGTAFSYNSGLTKNELDKVCPWLSKNIMDYNPFISEAIDLAELVRKKDSDYGSAYYKLRKILGPNYLLMRLWEKLMRLTTLSNKQQEVSNESTYDTIQDIAGYFLLEATYDKVKDTVATDIGFKK